jgi:cis-3-alkyl-4-acyloxetan-2-one decarboxylase
MYYPDYPFSGQYANIKGLQLHYLDEGPRRAAPVIMLHGNPSWSFYYRKLLQVLRLHHRCIVPDHIGMGLSEKPSLHQYEFTLDRRVDDLQALLEQLDLHENITLILHDWGGMIGMAYASRFPERIKRLVILNTAAFHLPKQKALPWQLRLSRIPMINAVLNQGLNLFSRGATKYCVSRKAMPEDVAKAYIAPYDCWHNRLAVRKFVEAIPLKPGENGYDTVAYVDKNLGQFAELPMLVCWGMQDFVFDRHFLEEWLQRFPRAEVHRFGDAGHYILEDAAEDVIPLISEFIDNHPL